MQYEHFYMIYLYPFKSVLRVAVGVGVGVPHSSPVSVNRLNISFHQARKNEGLEPEPKRQDQQINKRLGSIYKRFL